MTTKSLNLTYWITTSTFCLMMATSGVLYLTSIGFKERFAHLGFPSYFRVELAFFKLIGVVVLLLPFPRFVKVCGILQRFVVSIHCPPGEGRWAQESNRPRVCSGSLGRFVLSLLHHWSYVVFVWPCSS